MLFRLGMLVRDRMSRHLLTVAPEDSVRRARILMREGDLHRLPVVVGTRLVGLLSQEDIWARLPASAVLLGDDEVDALLEHVSVGGIMSLRPAAVNPNASVIEAARLMREHRVRALPVVDRGELMGIITEGDVVDGLLALLKKEPGAGPSGSGGDGSGKAAE